MPALPATLISDALCIDQCIPDGLKLSTLIALFAQLSGMPSPIDTKSLMANACSVDQCIPPGMQMAVLIALASQASTTSSGTSASYHGAFANPNGNVTPTSTSDGALYYQDGATPNQWRWDVPSQSWLQNFGP